VNRYASDTVWLQAIDAVWPIRISGTPYSDAPVTLSWPGMVSWAWYKRSVPSHGKCGLPSSRPWWSRVPAEPMATALLPAAWNTEPARAASSRATRRGSVRAAAGCACAPGAAAAGFGGVADPMPLMNTSWPISSMSW
jgi:hypothetical protein